MDLETLFQDFGVLEFTGKYVYAYLCVCVCIYLHTETYFEIKIV